MRYAVITRHIGEYPVRLMCRVLEVAASGYYAWRKRSTSVERRIADEWIAMNALLSYWASDRTYGSPRVHQDLQDAGIHVSRKRVARLMKENGAVARRPSRGVRTTDSNHTHPIAPNLLQREFDVTGGAINRVWVTDITYVPTREGWLFLAVVLDLASRRVIGYSMRDALDADVAVSALQMALDARQPAPGLIHHSDRGVQYASTKYRELLSAHELRASMSRKGDCWDNAVAESFFATLELELIARHSWATRADARRAIFTYIETWYNRARRHSTLKYLSPVQYEEQLNKAA